MAPARLIATDLDGTLLDARTYSPAEALPTLRATLARGIPIVPCSAKTLAEQEPLRRELGLEGFPCIVENGSAVHFPARDRSPPEVLGLPADEVRARLRRIAARTGVALTGYQELGPTGVARLTGLDLPAAARAAERQFSETLVDAHAPEVWQRLAPEFAVEGLVCAPGGRFHTVTGVQANKGTAWRRVIAWFNPAKGPAPVSIGIGDSPNDLALLQAVDRAYLVQRPDGTWAPLELPGLRRIAAVGPAGWSLAVRTEWAQGEDTAERGLPFNAPTPATK
jgi:mannosyl-3-phosphoglycerate phosphatase family protein